MLDSPEVAAAYLFGSSASGDDVTNDLDVLILLYPDADKGAIYISAICHIAEALKIPSDKVDILYFDLTEADPWVLLSAVNEGILLKNADPELLSDYIEQLSRYFLENDVILRRAEELRRQRREAFCADQS